MLTPARQVPNPGTIVCCALFLAACADGEGKGDPAALASGGAWGAEVGSGGMEGGLGSGSAASAAGGLGAGGALFSTGGGGGAGGSGSGGLSIGAGGFGSGGIGSGAQGSGGAASGGAGSGGAAESLPDITIYIAGDSIVSTYADTPSPSDQAGWGQMLHEIFDARVTVENRAIGGRTALWFHLEGGTAWVLDRIQPEDYFFIEFGTNDSHPTATFTVDGVTYPRFADAQTDFKQHLLDYYIEPTRAKSATPVLVTPPPRNSAYCGKGNSLGGYAQAMRELGEAEGVLVLDNNQRTFDHLAAICPAPTPEDFFFVRPDNSVDGTHFQENGARHMADFLGAELKAAAAGPYRYLLP